MPHVIRAATYSWKTSVPRPIRDLAKGRPTRLIWENRMGGSTALVESRSGDIVVKWQPGHGEVSLAAEAGRLAWLHGRHPVPEVVEYHAIDDGELLVTNALPAGGTLGGMPW